MPDVGPHEMDGGRSDAGEPRDGGPLVDGSSADGGEDAPPLRVAVLSDMNGSYGSTTYASTVSAAVDRVLAWAPDLVLSTGDMVAGQRAGLDYRAMWAGFHSAVSDRLAAASIPFAITPGNHDASAYPAYSEERAIFISEWDTTRKPDLAYLDDSLYPVRYSFRMGPALFVSLDSTTVGTLSGDQMSWLEDQLVAGADAPVKIVYGHVPLYPFAVGRETEVIGDAALETLLNDHEVDLFVSGHHHAYYPGRRGSLRLVSMACLGSGPRSLIGEDSARGRSVVLFEVERSAIRELDAFGGAAYDVRVSRAELPAQVGSGETAIGRDDL